MCVLVLDDDLERIEKFKMIFPGMDYATNPGDAIELLKKNEYEIIHLDYDLKFEHYITHTVCDKTTGLCVAKWLAENPENNSNAEIIIHSLNWQGVDLMMEVLKERSPIERKFTEL